MTFSEILNILLGGGMITLIVAIVTLRATVRKANADAEKAKAEAKKAKAEAERAIAEAESVRITNVENATRILIDNIVKPLTDELNATRREFASIKREMQRLRKAVEAAGNCPHFDGCPVLRKLRDNQKDSDPAVADGADPGCLRHGSVRNKDDPERGGASEPRRDGDPHRQPP